MCLALMLQRLCASHVSGLVAAVAARLAYVGPCCCRGCAPGMCRALLQQRMRDVTFVKLFIQDPEALSDYALYIHNFIEIVFYAFYI